MPCKNCGKDIIMTTPKPKAFVKSGKTFYFVSRKGWGVIDFVYDGKTWTFSETSPIEAPAELKSVVFLEVVPAPKKADVTLSSPSDVVKVPVSEKDKKGGK